MSVESLAVLRMSRSSPPAGPAQREGSAFKAAARLRESRITSVFLARIPAMPPRRHMDVEVASSAFVIPRSGALRRYKHEMGGRHGELNPQSKFYGAWSAAFALNAEGRWVSD